MTTSRFKVVAILHVDSFLYSTLMRLEQPPFISVYILWSAMEGNTQMATHRQRNMYTWIPPDRRQRTCKKWIIDNSLLWRPLRPINHFAVPWTQSCLYIFTNTELPKDESVVIELVYCCVETGFLIYNWASANTILPTTLPPLFFLIVFNWSTNDVSKFGWSPSEHLSSTSHAKSILGSTAFHVTLTYKYDLAVKEAEATLAGAWETVLNAKDCDGAEIDSRVVNEQQVETGEL